MAKDKKMLSKKEIEKKITDLKIELLKQPLKRKSIKKEIARLLTMEKLVKLNEDSSSTENAPKGVPSYKEGK